MIAAFSMVYADFANYVAQCAPQVHVSVMAHLVKRESSFNPFAIGIVGGRLERQPKSLPEAVATAKMLIEKGINFSAGISMINVHNLRQKGLDIVSVFDVCQNLRAGSEILLDCHDRAMKEKRASGQAATEYALSCYYSNNFTTGFKDDYVGKIIKSAYESRAGLAR